MQFDGLKFGLNGFKAIYWSRIPTLLRTLATLHFFQILRVNRVYCSDDSTPRLLGCGADWHDGCYHGDHASCPLASTAGEHTRCRPPAIQP